MATSSKVNLGYDVIVIGSGIAGALLAYRLAKAKVRVLVLEAGGMPEEFAGRATLVRNFAASASKGQDSPYTGEAGTPYYVPPPPAIAPQGGDEPSDQPYYNEENPDVNNHRFKSWYERLVGGALWHWQGLVPRMMPNDFQMQKAFFKDKKYPAVRDWPIGYSDLAPYYREAEYEMGVAGNAATDRMVDSYFGIAEADGKRGYPPKFGQGIPATYLDQYLGKKLKGDKFQLSLPDGTTHSIPLWVTQVMQAKNAAPFDGRPACDGHGSCVPLCPIKAKYEALFHVEKAIKAGAELHANAMVTKLTFDASGKVTSVTYKDWLRKEEKQVRARVVVLAGNAIESPRLLLHSEMQQSRGPNRWIGKFLMDHPGTSSYGLVPDPVYPFRGPTTTSNITTTSDGPFRAFHAGFRTSLLNYGWTTGAPRGVSFDPPSLTVGPQEDRAGTVLDFVHNAKLIGGRLQEKIRHHAHRQIVLGTALEQLPDESNSVALSDKQDVFGVPLPKLTYYYDDPSGYTREGLKAVRRFHEYVFKRLGATAYRLFPFDAQGELDKPGFFGAGHIMGTTRMGKEGEARVVDAQCRSVDHANLYVLGSSVFVTGAVANPTLTIAALSLRAANAIQTELQRMQ